MDRRVWLVQRIHTHRPVGEQAVALSRVFCECSASRLKEHDWARVAPLARSGLPTLFSTLPTFFWNFVQNGAGTLAQPKAKLTLPPRLSLRGQAGATLRGSGGSASAQASLGGAFQIGRSLTATAGSTQHRHGSQGWNQSDLDCHLGPFFARRHPSSPPTVPSPSSPFLLHPPHLPHDALDIAPRYISLTPPSPSAHDLILARSVNLYTHVRLSRDPVLLLILGSRSIIASSIRQARRPSYLSRTFNIARYAAGHCTLSPL